MTAFSTRNRKARNQTSFERRERWSRTRLMATTGLGGALAGMALGGGNAWGQVGPNTLPQNGQVVAGQATISQQGQNTLNINQTSNRAAINWSSFDVGQDATVNFYQPNSGSWTVNRVTAGTSASQILGSVNANGNIIVINPNGVIFGQGSRVDVNGIIATTSNISNQNFMAGNMTFDQPGNPNAMVVNQGEITVRDAGLVAFVAPGVSNSGTITANLGRVSLASGNKFTVDLYGDKLVSIAVDGGTTAAPVGPDGKPVDALVSNSGQILADGGRVQMTAQQASAIVDNAINMSGVVRAQSAYTDKNGDIVLDAGPAGNVVVSGTLDVSGKAAGQTGGNVAVLGSSDVIVTGTARIDASGSAGGGKVKIGGDLQGKAGTRTAQRTGIGAGAVITADAIDNGNGGTVIVWADNFTSFNGAISAKGGTQSGNGGLVEVSGKQSLAFNGTVDTSAANGLKGTLLLDPATITIVDTVPNINGDGTTGDDITTAGDLDNAAGDFPGANSTITDDALEGLLATNNVTLAATSAITVNVQLDWTSVQSLTLDAPTLNLNADIAPTGGGTFVGGATVVTINVNSLAPGGGTIGDALVLASDGDVINVGAGTYNEALTINKEVTLNGAQAGISAVGGSRTQGDASSESIIVASGLTIAADNVRVDGFDLQFASLGAGIVLDASTSARQGIAIVANFLTNSSGSGIGVTGGMGFGSGVNVISGNSISVSTTGVGLDQPGSLGAGGNHTISNNAIVAGPAFDAIRANSNDSLVVTGNTLMLGGGGSGIRVTSDATSGVSNITIGGNTIVGTGAVGTGINIDDVGAAAGTIELVFQGANTITNVATGVYLSGIGISMPQQSFGSMAFSNVSGNYIWLDNVAVQQLFIGATQVTFDGLTYAASGPAGQAAINGKIVDNADNAALSVIVLEATDVNVTAAQGLDGIQDAIVVIEGFGGGADVVLESGTYGGIINGSAANGIVITGSDIGIVGDAGGGTILDFSSVSTSNAITVNGANISMSNLNIEGLAAISNAAIKVSNGPFTITGGSIIGTGVTTYGLLIDPPGPITISGMNLANFAGDAINIINTAGNVIVTGNTINGTGGDAIEITNTSTGVGVGNNGSITVSGNTIGNDDTGAIANIGGYAVFIQTATGSGAVIVDSNAISTGPNAATIGLNAIFVDNIAGDVQITNNEIGTGTGSAITFSGIVVNQVAGSVTIDSNTVATATNGNGIYVGFSNNPVTVSNNSISNVANVGIYLQDVSDALVSGNNVTNAGIGLLIQDTLDDVANNVTVSGNIITGGAGSTIGISVSDPHAFGNSPTTVTFGAGNVIRSLTNAGADALVFDGADTAIAGNSLNDIQFLAINDQFVILSNGALFNPDTPTVIDGSDATWDLNNNGVVDAGENFSTFDPADIDTQPELDAAWGVGGVFTNAAAVQARITDYVDNQTLGLISPLGNALVVNSPTDWGGGLRGIQNAIDAAGSGYYVFVNAGSYGAPQPFVGPDNRGLVIDKELNLIGRQGFSSAVTGGRTSGNAATESILNFADPAVASTFMVTIDSSDVTVRGFDMVGDATQTQGGVQISNLSGGVNVNVTNNYIRGSAPGTPLAGPAALRTNGSLINSGTFDGNNIFNVSNDGISLAIDPNASTFTLQGNRVVAGTGAGDDAIVLSQAGGATALLVSGNTVEGAGGFGIAVSGFSTVEVSGNTLASSAAGAAIGQDAIRITGGSAVTVNGNTIATGAGNVLTVGSAGGSDAGIRIVNPGGNFTITNNRIGDGDVGILIDNTAGAATSVLTLSGNTIDGTTLTINEDAVRVSNTSNQDMTVILASSTMTGFTDAGIDVTDTTTGAGLTNLDFNAGVILNNGARGVVITGPTTRIIGQTFDNLVIGSAAGSITGNYIELQNAALHGNPNGTPFDPLEYNAQNVTFNGVTPNSLDPAGSPANQATLAGIENRIVHYLDTTLADYNTMPIKNMRGLIRLRTDSFSLDSTVGLNGVQLAVTASNAGDTIYLAAGRFADASDLLPIINQELTGVANDWLLIDRDITIIGARAGISAANGGRTANDQTTESILDFDLATGGTSGGVVIASSGVIIDGVSIRATSDQDFGVRIYSAALGTLGNGPANNLQFINNFVQGGSSNIGGNGIESFGAGTITDMTLTGNALDSIGSVNTHDAIDLSNITNLTLQNNRVGTSAGTAATVLGHGFLVNNSTYATSVSGNSIFDVGQDGIHLDNTGLSITAVTNIVSIAGNTIDNTGFDGIDTAAFRTVTVQNNTVGLTGADGTIGAHGIYVHDTGGLALIGGSSTTGNTVDGTGNSGIYVVNTGVSGTGGVQVSFNSVGQNADIGISALGGNGIEVSGTANGNVTVNNNLVGNTTVPTTINNGASFNGDGILVNNTLLGGVTVTANSVVNADDDGIVVVGTGLNVTVTDNIVASIGAGTQTGDGILVTGTGLVGTLGNLNGDVLVIGNEVSAVDGDGSADQHDGLSSGDGIRVSNVDGNAIVGNDGNTITDVGDDGIEINGVAGNVSSSNNTITNTSTVTTTGDGIVITGVGNAYFGGGQTNRVVYVSGNTITDVNGNGDIDTLTDGLSGGDGIRVSKVDGSVTVIGNTIQSIGNDGIQAYDINNTVLVTGNLLDSISDNSSTGDGIVVENTGKYAAIGGVAQGGSVTIVSNSVSNVQGGVTDDDDTLVAGAASQGLSTGDGIRVGAIDGEVLIGGTSGTANTVINVSGDGIQVYYVTGQNSTVSNGGVTVGHNFVYNVGAFGADADGDGIQISKTGRYGGATANFTGNVQVFNNTVNDVKADDTTDNDDGFTSGDGIRIVQADGHVSVSANLVGAGTSAAGIDNDGIQIHTITRSVLVTGNTVGSTGVTIGGGQPDGDGIVVESTGTLSGTFGVAGEGDVVITSNIVSNVASDGSDDTDGATVPVAGLDTFLTAGDGIRVGFADGQVTVGGTSTTGNTVTNVADDGIQVFAVTGNGVAAGGVAVSVTHNIVTTAGTAAVGGDGIVISYTGAFVTDPTGTAADFNGGVLVRNNTVNDVVGDGADDDDDRTAGDGIRIVSADGDVSILSNTIASAAGGDIDNDGIQVWDVTRAVTVDSNLVGSANASIGVGTVGNSDGDGIVIENTGFYSSYGASIATDFIAHVTVTNNVVRNVVGAADIDADGYNPNSGPGAILPDVDAQNAPNEFLSSGDGIRVAYIDGQATVSSNSVDTTAGDGIQAYYISGSGVPGSTGVTILNNNVSSVGNGAGGDGDGIVVSFTGGFGLGVAPTVGADTNSGGVLIQGNTVNGVIGNGPDRDDARSSGDGIRVRSADGFVSIVSNTIGSTADIDNDGIQVWDVTLNVTVHANNIGAGASIGTGASLDGDGIVVENTGVYTTGGGSYSAAGEGDVVVTSNVVRNVRGDGTDDADGAITDIVGGAQNDPDQFLTAGDGIRVGFVNGDVIIGGTTVGNSVSNVGDDGIQVYAVDGIGGTAGGAAVFISNNTVSLASAVGTGGDGIVVSYTGLFVSGAGGSISGTDGLVYILNNTVNDVRGDGTDDDDDRSAGDGIRVRSADTGVQIDGNNIATLMGGSISNDGIQVWDVAGSVTLNANTIGTGDSVGTGAAGTGDGIAVENVGGAFSTRTSSSIGNVIVTSNSVSNVVGPANTETTDGSVSDFPAAAPGSDPVQYLSSGDGIRVGFVSAQATISTNNITNTANDGIQAYMVKGINATDPAVRIVSNVISNVGNGTVAGQGDGDGIAVAYTGRFALPGATADGGVLIQGNIVDDVAALVQFDRDDGRTAGDGIRVRSADGAVSVLGNSVGVTSGSIANDGIQIADVTRAVTVDSNTIGSVANAIGSATVDGDGIVVEDTGQYASSGATFAATPGLGSVTVTNNTVTNVDGDGTLDRDGPIAAFSAGDGIRTTRIDGSLTINTNTLTGLGDDGIQVDTVAGSVTVSNNDIDDAGGLSGTADGIVIADVGNAYNGGIGPSGVTVIVADNSISDVAGDGTADPDDAQHSNGDGIRIVRIDGSVQALRNSIARVDDDGIYIGVIRQSVLVQSNVLDDMGGNSNTGDGIVVALTGTLAGGATGGGDVTILSNTVTNVNANAPATPDFDNPNNFYGATGAGLSAGDGIRSEQIDGDLVIGNSSATGNSILNTDDDGIQVQTVRGNVTILFNQIGTVGIDGDRGDGITVADVGAAYAGGTVAGVLVNVSNNTINGVNGDGTADPDDAQHSNGDGVRIVRVDGSVQTNTNTITSVDDDGIYIGAIRGAVTVVDNRLTNMGLDSDTGDGIVVALTGTLAGGASGAGGVTINNNTIANVNANTPGAPDFDDPLGLNGVGAGYSSGDGIRAENIDGNLTIGNSSSTGNSILNVDDDGIQVQTVRGNVTVLFNRISTVGVDSNAGDGITVADVGAAYAGGTFFGAVVNVSNNTIISVNGDGTADLDDANHSNGDGIRVVRVDGSVSTNTNTITSVDDDGIYIGVVRGSVNVRDNSLTNMGLDSDTGDGIVVALTGDYAGGTAGAGDVTILNNTVANVNANTPAALDFDNPNGFYGSTGAGFSAGDGIRAEFVGGDAVAGESSTTGNSIINVDDDGIQIDSVRGNVTALFNRIATVGVDGNKGDGIIVDNVGNAYTGAGPSGVVVNVSDNVISVVNGDGLADPDASQHSSGDGIRILRIDGSVQSNRNSIASVDDDGIYVGVVRGGVSVLNNRLDSIGLGSATGDGIVVAVTGEYANGTADGGDVTINGNSIANVDAGAPGTPDFDNPNGFHGGTGAGLTAGDGIRAEGIDGDVVVGVSGAGNSIASVDDDGIQIYSITGATTVTFNSILDVANDGTDSASGDGIQVNLTGQYAVSGFGVVGAGDVIVSNNDITNVQNTSVPALDDPEDLQTAGDGIRLHDISGDATVNNNVIDPIADDGIQMGNIDFTATANNNTITDVGFTSLTGDGILIFNTGIVGANDGNGSVTVNNNTITNVAINSGGTGAADPDDGGYGSNDGIRVVVVDGSVAIGGNRITNTRDDGVQAFDIQRTVNITNNVIATVGAGSNEGDGIVVHGTGTFATIAGPADGGAVTVSGNSISAVTGNGGADNDDGITSGDGVRVTQIDGNIVVTSNSIQNVGDDGIQAFNVIGGATVTGNRISIAGAISTTGDGIVIEELGNGTRAVVVSQNTIADVRGNGNVANVDDAPSPTTENDGIRIQDVAATTITVDANQISLVADDGVEVTFVSGDVVASNNVLNTIGTGTGGLGDGILINDVTGNASVTGNAISNVLSGNAGAADNVDGYTAGDGVRVSDVSLSVVINGNTVTNAADDGVQAKFIAGSLNIASNRVNSVSNVSNTGDGIDVTEITGNATITTNTITAVFGDGTADPDGSGLSSGDGIRVELTTGALVITGNSIGNVGDDGIQVDTNPADVTVSDNRIDDFGNLTAGAGDGIVVADTTGNVFANNNSVSNANGTAADLDDMNAAGDGIRIVRTSGNVQANSNVVSNVADFGIEIVDTGGTVNANNNSISGAANVGIAVLTTTGAVTTSGNSLANNGTGEATDIGIWLSDFASAVVTDNTIVNVTPGSLNIGIDIGNTIGPAVMITMTGNSIDSANTGLFIRDNVMGTVSTNTFTNNVVWGVQIDNTVSGNGIGQGLPGDVVPTIDILFRDNFLNGNGAPVPGDGVTRGGINNLNPGPNPGGFIFDARMNNFNGQAPFTTGTHFENPNTGGTGDAVSDWVRIDIPLILNPIIPYYDFGSLLDNFGRGGDAETPGDVLAIGAGFQRNGNLFDPYFVNVFGTPFSLAGDSAQAVGEAAQYGMCYLANMWRATSCRKAPPRSN